MGLFSAIFGGSSKQSSSQEIDVTSQVDVSVDPQIAVDVDTQPIGEALQRFVDSAEGQAATLAASVVSGAGLQAAGVQAVGEALSTAQRDAAAIAAGAQRDQAVLAAAGQASIGEGLSDIAETARVIGLVIAGVSLLRVLA